MSTQNKTQHTPGPWTDTEKGFIRAEDRSVICRTFDELDEEKANARLISAAPELLEALREAKREVGGLRHLARHQITDTEFRESQEREEKWSAAIAKAEGRG